MVLGFHSRPSHVAQNIIVGLDFDGTISYSFHLRVAYAKKNYGVDLPIDRVLSETWPRELGMGKYWQMADAVDNVMIKEHQLAHGCKEVLTYLHSLGFRFAVVSKRGPLRYANIKAGTGFSPGIAPAWFVEHHGLPISYYHATDHSSELKWDLCNKLHARAFLDDDLKILEGLRDTFVKPFFIRQPWNIHQPTLPSDSGVITVTNWIEFGRGLLYLKAMHEAICYFNRIENAYYNLPKIAAFWKRNPELCNSYLERYKEEAARAKAWV